MLPERRYVWNSLLRILIAWVQEDSHHWGRGRKEIIVLVFVLDGLFSRVYDYMSKLVVSFYWAQSVIKMLNVEVN